MDQIESALLQSYLQKKRRSPGDLLGLSMPAQQEPVGEIVMPPEQGPIGPPAIDAEPPPQAIPPPAQVPKWRPGPGSLEDQPLNPRYPFNPDNPDGVGAYFPGTGWGKTYKHTPIRDPYSADGPQAPPMDPRVVAHLRGSQGPAPVLPGDSPIPDDIPIGPKIGPPAVDAAPLLGAQEAPAEPVAPTKPEESTPEAEEKARAKEIRRLERWKDLSEGLGQLGQGLAGLRGHLSQKDFAKPDTSAIDRELARAEDILSPQEQKMLEAAFGPGTIPKGLRRSTLQHTLPSIAGFLGRRESQEARMAKDERKETAIEKRSLRTARLTAKNRFETHPVIVAADKAKTAAQGALRALDTGDELNSGLAQLSATVQAARAAGDTRLSNEDIDRWTTRWGYKGWIDKGTRLVAAKLPKEHIDELRGILKNYIKTATDTRRLRARLVTGQVAGELDVDPDELGKQLRGDEEGGGGTRTVEIPGEGQFEATEEQIKAMEKEGVKFSLPGAR